MRKKLRRLKDISEVIEIKTSKENDQVHLSQQLKYKPTKCEDCPRVCASRRIIHSRLAFSLNPPQWLHQCNQCRQYWSDKTKSYSTSMMGILTQYSRKNYRQ